MRERDYTTFRITAGLRKQLRGFTPDALNLLVKTSVGSNRLSCYFLTSLGPMGT